MARSDQTTAARQSKDAISRRRFLTMGMAAAAAASALGIDHAISPSIAGAQNLLPGAPAKQLVVIFLRGGMDGLSAVVPTAWADYTAQRPTVGVAATDTIAMPGAPGWGLHPALQDLLPRWNANKMTVVQGAGNIAGARSHFKEMERIERGIATGGNDLNDQGWIGRALQDTGGLDGSLFRAVAIEGTVPRSLFGFENSLSIARLSSFDLPLRSNLVPSVTASTKRDMPVHRSLCNGLDMVRGVDVGTTPIGPLTSTRSGQLFADAYSILDSNLGTEVVTISLGGWDLHANMGRTNAGDMTNLLADLGAGLSAFLTRLDNAGIGDRVTTVVISEFGRRVEENGNTGTDHGKGGAMLLFSDSLSTSQVRSVTALGSDDSLDASAPVIVNGEGDVEVTTDYRDVLGAAAQHALGANPASLFPNSAGNPYAYTDRQLFVG